MRDGAAAVKGRDAIKREFVRQGEWGIGNTELGNTKSLLELRHAAKAESGKPKADRWDIRDIVKNGKR